jgi:hypothetical protein
VAATRAAAQSLESCPVFAAALAITAIGWCMAVRAPARTDSVSILSLTMAVLFAQVGFSKAVLPCFLRRPRLNVFGAERNTRI